MKKCCLTIYFAILNICILLCQSNSFYYANYTDIYGVAKGRINSILVQTDGKIISGGWNYNNIIDGKITSGGWNYNNFNYAEEFLIFRYNPDGTLDTSFGFDGIVLTGYYGDDAVGNSLAIQADGKILLAGISCSGYDCKLMLMRYNQDGSTDNTFGTNGHVFIEPQSNEVYDYPFLEIQDDGKILTSVGMRNLLNQGIVLFRFSPDGSLDDSFGNNGKVKTNTGVLVDADARSVKCQTDGKIVVCGFCGINAVTVRYEADGAIDNTFGNDGIVFEDSFSWNCLIVQTDGKIVVGGYTHDAQWYSIFALARYNTNGSPDYSFGSQGKVMTGLPFKNLRGHSLEIQSDEKLVLAGTNHYGDREIVVARYNSNGTLDNSFGGDGIAVIDPGYECEGNSIAIGSNDKYLIGGYAAFSFYLDQVNLTMRLNSNGELDNTFNLNGISSILKDSEDLATSLTLVNDSLIVLAGAADSTFSVVRYNLLEGDEDYSFGRNGIVRAKIGGMPNSVVCQADNKTILTGNSCLSRFNSDGLQDTSFGISGILTLDSVTLRQSHIQQDGKIVVSGNTTLPDNKYIIKRFNPDGSPDISFGSGGETITGFGNYGDFVYSSFMQADGKILLAGDTKVSDSISMEIDYDFALARYNVDGSPDSSFGINGKVTTPILNSVEHCNSMIIQTDGKILCTGNTDSSFLLIRYEANGEIDQNFASNGIFTSSEIAHFGNKVFNQYGEMILVLVDSIKLVRFNYDGTIDDTFLSAPLFNPENNEGLFDGFILPEDYIALAGKRYNDFCLMIIPPGGFTQIQEKEEEVTELFTYPNPVHDIINVRYELKDSEFVSIELFDITGRNIKQFKANEFCSSGIYTEKFPLDNQFSPGIYILQLSTQHSRHCVKIIKK